MLKRLDQRLRELAFGVETEAEIPTGVEGNPLSLYLRVYQRQHRVIFLLYRGLLLAFGTLMVVVSFLIDASLEPSQAPVWAPYALGLVDLALTLGFFKALFELKKYKAKNAELLALVLEHLERDLQKLERIKAEQAQMMAKKKKFKILLGEPKPATLGWDHKLCPKCGQETDVVEEVCPQCFYLFGPLIYS